MLLTIIYIILQTTVTVTTVAQVINYILLIVNAIYTVVVTVFIIPTWKEHKALVEDYNNRKAPSTAELRAIEKAIIEKQGKDISEIKHSINQLSNQLEVALTDKLKAPDVEEILTLISELRSDLKRYRNDN